MEKDNKEELVIIAERLEKANIVVASMGQMNTWNQSIEEQIDKGASYRIAISKRDRLKGEYDIAFDKYWKNKEQE